MLAIKHKSLKYIWDLGVRVGGVHSLDSPGVLENIDLPVFSEILDGDKKGSRVGSAWKWVESSSEVEGI